MKKILVFLEGQKESLKRTSFEKNDFQILVSPGNQKNIPPHNTYS